MPGMETARNVVILPNEYKEKMRMAGVELFLPVDHKHPNPAMPLIYVTHPDNLEDEIWIPPTHEQSQRSPTDEDSDDSDSVCHYSSESLGSNEWSEDPNIKVSSAAFHTENVDNAEKMWFYRTGWQNRSVYANDSKGSKLLYYADIPWRAWGTSLTIHRNGKSGEVVAESHRSAPGQPFLITFSDPHQASHLSTETGGKLVLRFGSIFSRSHRFQYRGRDLAWTKGITKRKLIDLDTNEVIAEFHVKLMSTHTDGNLVISQGYLHDQRWIDVIVTSGLTYQQREREIRRNTDAAVGGSG